MTDKLDYTKWHKKQAVDCFNGTWDLIDKKDRTTKDDIAMIHMAHASRFHWGHVGGALEFARGEWQISRVYSLILQGESALYHGKESLRLCMDNNIGGFDLAFAYEAVARGFGVNNNTIKRDEYVLLAEKACEAIEDKGDKDYVLGELKSI